MDTENSSDVRYESLENVGLTPELKRQVLEILLAPDDLELGDSVITTLIK